MPTKKSRKIIIFLGVWPQTLIFTLNDQKKIQVQCYKIIKYNLEIIIIKVKYKASDN